MTVSALIYFLVLAAAVTPPVYSIAPKMARSILPLVPLVPALFFFSLVPQVMAGHSLHTASPWVPSLELSLLWHVDGLALVFALLISVIGTLVTVYAGAYFHESESSSLSASRGGFSNAGFSRVGFFYGVFFLFMASMLGIVLTDHAIALYVFWELTSLSSYFLIGFKNERASARSSARKALLVTTAGGLSLLVALLLISFVTGTYVLSEMPQAFGDWEGSPTHISIVLLLLFAAFTKSAQFPFHFWLPSAMEAPTPASAYLHAATMVKGGVYLVARMSPTLSGSAWWQDSLLWVGGVTALIGAIFALGTTQYKRSLAYSTVSALGLMIMLVGIGTELAFTAMLVFLVTHAFYKGALFLVAGAVDHAVHDLNLERLGSLRRSMPWTATAAALAAASLAAIPPFLGYIAKEKTYEATLDVPGSGSVLLTLSVVLVGALFFAIAWTTGVRPFWRPPKREQEANHPEHEVNWRLWSAPLVLGMTGLSFALWSSPLAEVLTVSLKAIRRSGVTPHEAELGLWHGLEPPFFLSLFTFVLGIGVCIFRTSIPAMGQRLRVLARFGPAKAYAHAIEALDALAHLQTRVLQSGYLRRYLMTVVASLLVAVGTTWWATSGALPRPPPLSKILDDLRFYEVLVAVVMILAALAAVISRSRFASIFSLGIVGYGMALNFVFFGAPEVGTTQLVVETLTLILLVLSFHHLPTFAQRSSVRTRLRHVLVSSAFGAFMTLLVLAAVETRIGERPSRYFGEVSLSEAHSRNVVNAILTNFRALDTLGEILVLSVAAMGVIAALKFPGRKGRSR